MLIRGGSSGDGGWAFSSESTRGSGSGGSDDANAFVLGAKIRFQDENMRWWGR